VTDKHRYSVIIVCSSDGGAHIRRRRVDFAKRPSRAQLARAARALGLWGELEVCELGTSRTIARFEL
jgi:hypothetical protein